MPGTLTISTLSDGTNSTSATNCIQGSAKAWVNFDGASTSPITPRAAYNVSSVTKNGTGDYTINFTNALADANYAPVAIFGYTTSAPTEVARNCTGKTYSTGSFRFVNQHAGSVAVDYNYQTVAIFR